MGLKRYFTLHDAINYWVFVGEIFRSDDIDTAHTKALDELDHPYVASDRLLDYRFAAVPLQKNFQAIKWTSPHTMREVRELVRDYFSYGRAGERLRTAQNLYRSGDFRACAERLYIEQKGRVVSVAAQNKQKPASQGRSSFGITAEQLQENNVVIHATTLPDSYTTPPENDIHRNNETVQTCHREISSGLRRSRSSSSTSDASSIEIDRRTSLAMLAKINVKKRKLNSTISESSTTVSVDRDESSTDTAAQEYLQSKRRSVQEKNQSDNITTPISISDVNASKEGSTTGLLNHKRSDIIRICQDLGTVPEMAHVAGHLPDGTTPTKSDANLGYPMRAAALIASSNIRTSYRQTTEDLDETSSVDSSEPPIKYQYTEENRKHLDLGECQFCGGFYSRIQGGGLIQHEIYWCVLNPQRRPRIRWNHDQESANVSSQRQHETGTPAKDAPVPLHKLEAHSRISTTKSSTPAASHTNAAHVMQTSSATIEKVSHSTKQSLVPNDQPVIIQVSNHHEQSSQAPEDVALQANVLGQSNSDVQAGHELAIAGTTQNDSRVCMDKSSGIPLVKPSVSVTPLTTTETITLNEATADTSKITATPTKLTKEDWEMIEMYLDSGDEATEILEMVDETLQGSTAKSDQPCYVKSFLRHLLQAGTAEEKEGRKQLVLKYLKVAQTAGFELKFNVSVFRAIMNTCERKKEMQKEFGEVMKAYLALFAPVGNCKTWRYLSRLEGGLTLAKRHKALTD